MASRRKAAAARSPRTGLFTRLVALVRAAARPVAVYVLPVVALVAVCVIGLRWADAHVAQAARYRVEAPRLATDRPKPSWWQPEFEQQINRSVAFADGRSILDPQLAGQVAAGYLSCPWVHSVARVTKRYPDRLVAELALRQPGFGGQGGAVVEIYTRDGPRYLLVAEDGVRLPATFARWPQPGLDVPFVRGVRTAPPQPGEIWRERTVTAAMQIVEHLDASDVISQAIRVTGVDVNNYRGRIDPQRSGFLVLAEHNCVIAWGRAPNTDRPGELPVVRKIRSLERYIQQGKPVRNHKLIVRFGDCTAEPRSTRHGR
jgi:hypothetical protein